MERVSQRDFHKDFFKLRGEEVEVFSKDGVIGRWVPVAKQSSRDAEQSAKQDSEKEKILKNLKERFDFRNVVKVPDDRVEAVIDVITVDFADYFQAECEVCRRLVIEWYEREEDGIDHRICEGCGFRMYGPTWERSKGLHFRKHEKQERVRKVDPQGEVLRPSAGEPFSPKVGGTMFKQPKKKKK